MASSSRVVGRDSRGPYWRLMNKVDEITDSVPIQVDEMLTQLREKCSATKAIISNAEQEAITIVTDAAQRIEAMTKKSEKGLDSMEKELADVKEEMKAMQCELKNWEDEKKRIANTRVFEPMVKLDVGGKLFTTATATLTRFPDTMLGAMFSGRHALIPDKDGAYCIDRDGTHFREILNFLRGTAGSTQKMIEARLSPEAMEELKVEADFYGVKDLMFPTTTVSITGATGICTGEINGTYQKTTELSGGMPVYAKVGNSDMWLVYVASSKDWKLQPTNNKGSNAHVAYCKVPHQCLPQECPAGEWRLYEPESKKIPNQSAIAVNVEN